MKNILLLGGGHGLSSVLESLKIEKEYNIKAIIATSDSGGHTGKIIEEFSIPAVGDLRRNLAATLDSFPLLQQMLDYRFETLHNEKDISLGNLMLLSLIKNKTLEEVMIKFYQDFDTKILLLPLYNEKIDLCAKYTDGTHGKKEHLIPCQNKQIEDVYYQKELPLSHNVIKSIKEADYIIIGPGSLYTSVGAVLADKNISNLIKESKAKTIYICNIMTEPKETDNYNVKDHLSFIEKKINKQIDFILANSKKIAKEQKNKYKTKGSYLVKKSNIARVIYTDLIDEKQTYIRHDKIKLSKALRKIIDNI